MLSASEALDELLALPLLQRAKLSTILQSSLSPLDSLVVKPRTTCQPSVTYSLMCILVGSGYHPNNKKWISFKHGFRIVIKERQTMHQKPHRKL